MFLHYNTSVGNRSVIIDTSEQIALDLRYKRQRKMSFLLIVLIFLITATISLWAVQDAVNRTTENQALSVAEIVAKQAATARSVYAENVAKKLKADGTGPHVDFAQKKGFVPIPAQFLKMVGLESANQTNYLYKYKPVSKWNLEPTQGLDDEFLLWAWPQLEAQDQGDPGSPIKWKPVARFEGAGDNKVLRYLYADPAAQESCVTCHNSYEEKVEITNRRIKQGIATEKKWKQHQLMGALSITIPLAKVQFVAFEQIRETTILIFGILLSSFITLIFFNMRMLRQERELTQKVDELENSEEKRYAANKLLAAQQDLERAFSELSTYMQGINQHAMVSVTDLKGKILEVNDKFCYVSGYRRTELIGQDHKIMNSHKHSQSFFSEMWQTILRGDIWSGEICNLSKSGKLFWVDASIVPLKDDNGNIQRFISIRIDITERKKNEDRMTYMGTHDALTGLPNRILLMDRIKQALAHDKRYGKYAAVLFIDLDQFKIINDSLGHDIGDLLLIEVTSRLLSCVRDEDTVARQGGDEFIILLPNISDPSHAEIVGKAILDAVVAPYLIQGHDLRISASIGISIFPDDSENVNTLLKMSDTAMYFAKENGRNNCQRFRSEMNACAEEKHELLLQLRQAISNNEFELHFQPIVEISTNEIISLEALLRWKHPLKGLIPPSAFIPLAEESGLIVEIGEWVFTSGCKQMKAWQEQGFNIPQISINLSVRQFHQRNFVSMVENILKGTGLSGQCLELEITEGVLMENTDELIATMHKIKDMGIKISVDDFGTGYSSLSYIKSFPIDVLKIDRSFVSDITHDLGGRAIVKTIIALAHSLRMKVVAEGVEDVKQLQLLTEEGCDMYQGYYFSKPMPVIAIESFLLSKK